MGIRVLIVDDHNIVREGMKMLLALEPDMDIVGEASNGNEAVTLAHKLRPDVVLMDLVMPEMDGIKATKIIRNELPCTEVIALTSVLEDRTIFDAIQVGAISYLLKNTDVPKLIEAIRAAANGQVTLTPQISTRLIREFRDPQNLEILTDREEEVLENLAKGFSNKEIAQALYISEKTVKTHVSSILSKLNLPSRTRAALYALKKGLISLEDIQIH